MERYWRIHDDTREFVCGILMEALLPQDGEDVDGVVVCDSLFALLNINKQQQQQPDITTDTTCPITIPPTNKKFQPTPNTKRHTHTTKRSKGNCDLGQ